MVGFFSDFKLVRNFFSPYLRSLDIEKIDLSRILFVIFTVLTFNTDPAGASPPTHYVSGTNGFSPYTFTGLSPEIAAQEYIAYVNSRLEMGRRLVATGSCHVFIYGSELGLYICPYRYTYPQGQGQDTDYSLDVYTRCGPQAQALWNGSEFYCPPTPECDAPVQQ